MFYIIKGRKTKSSSQIYLWDGAILALHSTAGNSIKFKCAALTLKYLEGFIEEPDGLRQIPVAEPNVPFVRILCKVSRDGLERRGLQFGIFTPVM